MSFLPSISAGNLRKRLPASFKFDNDLTWTRPSQWLDLGTSTYDGTTPEKIIGLVAVFPNDVAPANNYVAFHLDTTDDSNFLVDWGDGNPAETTHESDFSSGVDGYSGSSHGSVSRVATHNGKSDVLLYQSSGGRDGIKNTSVDLLTGNAYTLTFDYYADSSFSGVWGVEQSFPTGGRLSIASNFPTIVTGAWTSVSLTIPATRPSTSSIERLEIRPQADSNSVYANTQTGDQIGFKNIKVVLDNSGSAEYVRQDSDQHHVYDYDSITSDTSTAKATPYRGYKQAKFEVTLTGSAKFSNISFDVNGPFVTHTHYAIRQGPNILDLFVSTSNAVDLNINNNKNMRLVEQLEVRNTSSNRLNNPQRLYSGCRSLQSIPFVPWIRNDTSRDYLYAFQQCNRLKFLPDEFASQDKFWFKNMSRLQSCFQQCQQLEYLPEGLFGDSEQTNLGSCYNAFYLCYKLRYIPYLGIPTGTGQNVQLRNIFHSAISLTNIPKGFTFQTVEGNGLNGVFHECRSIKDFSAIFDGTTDAFANINRTTVQMQSLFRGFSQLTEFPYVGNFNKCDNATQVFYNCRDVIRFNSLYTHLDFTNAKDMASCFQNMECLEELPEIKVRSLTDQSSTNQTFAQMRRLTSIKVTGMIAGASDGEYYRMFINCHSLNCIDGIDFSFATETSDYYQMFNQTRNINAIKFPGTFRAGYASPRINVAVANHSDISGEYHITEAGTGYAQASGNGELTVAESGGNYTWTLKDSSDDTPTETSTAASNTQYTPWAADWSGATNAVTFTEVKTGFKYTVTGGSGDGLRYSPIKRTQMLEIFNQLADVSYSATIDIRNNSYTADLTSDDIAIATNKGWTVINNEGTFT